jgi:hypothetical protein
MYGVILQSMIEAIKKNFGDKVWQDVKRLAKIEHDFFNTHQQYNEAIVQRMLRSLSLITSIFNFSLTRNGTNCYKNGSFSTQQYINY